jgi:hypothetical protein
VKNKIIGFKEAEHEDDFIIYKLRPDAI